MASGTAFIEDIFHHQNAEQQLQKPPAGKDRDTFLIDIPFLMSASVNYFSERCFIVFCTTRSHGRPYAVFSRVAYTLDDMPHGTDDAGRHELFCFPFTSTPWIQTLLLCNVASQHDEWHSSYMR
jgi:hypothetical protein